MAFAQIVTALERLQDQAATHPSLGDNVQNYWLIQDAQIAEEIPTDALSAARFVAENLAALSREIKNSEQWDPVWRGRGAEFLFRWCECAVSQIDVCLAPLLRSGEQHFHSRELIVELARERVIQGPLLDALLSVPLLGSGDQLLSPENREARARLEILIWEAGASAWQIPELGRWLGSKESTFEAMIARLARGSLRGRVLAARSIEVGARGMAPVLSPELLGKTLQVLQPLLLHPEPLVSTHAARALGQLAGSVEHLEGMLLDWLGGESRVLRRRAMTAFCSLPASRLRILKHELEKFFLNTEEEEWVLSAAAAGSPSLYVESPELAALLTQRIVSGGGGAKAALQLARGLASLWRRGEREKVKPALEALRSVARRARTDWIEEWCHWLGVISATDPVEGAERDPLDIERGLENLIHLAAQYDDEEADARAARFAGSLQRTFEEAHHILISPGSLRHRASGMNAVEGGARSMALRLWVPQLTTHPRGEITAEPYLRGAEEQIARFPLELLELVRERRQGGDTSPLETDAWEVLAVRVGGYALDACSVEGEGAANQGRMAHETCRWLSQIEGVADGERQLPEPLREALSGVFWRLVDLTRGTALGEVDDVEWLGPFAAWWALVIDRPVLLQQLAVALPMIRQDALDRCCQQAEALRQILSGEGAASSWMEKVSECLAELRASGTELSSALLQLAQSLVGFEGLSGRSPQFESACKELVLAAERLREALADPVQALHPSSYRAELSSESGQGERAQRQEATQRITELLVRAIRTRELSLLDVWFASLGPLPSSWVEAAVRRARDKTPPLPPSHRKLQPEMIEGYELVRPLGEGGVGKVWLVRKPGADRLFVLKIPKTEALANASETEKAGILASFVEEAKALAGLYHPNVANIIDRGVSQSVPFLVLELLIGADLQKYAAARLLSLEELRPLVVDTCAGLAALHGAQLVHRDIKPANIWLRLALPRGEGFDPTRHRESELVRPLSAVVIDFGMVRPMRVAAELGGRFVAGTPGYIAPEQVLDPLELDGRADIYSLAGTIYNVTTGRTFFDEISSSRERIFAHMQKAPLEEVSRTQAYPAQLTKLLRAATALSPQDRPSPQEFARAFEACV